MAANATKIADSRQRNNTRSTKLYNCTNAMPAHVLISFLRHRLLICIWSLPIQCSSVFNSFLFTMNSCCRLCVINDPIDIVSWLVALEE